MDEEGSAQLQGDQKASVQANRLSLVLSLLFFNYFVLCFWLKDTSPLETLIPEEYHMIKNKGLRGLQCYDE